MIVYVAVLTTLFSLLVLAMVYLADLWEREPLDLIQYTFLAGLGAQLLLVLTFHVIGDVGAWSGWAYLVTLAVLSLYLPALLATEDELNEAFDGVVYAVAFAAGAGSVVHLFNLPGLVAPYPERAVLGGTPGVGDLLRLSALPEPRGELADLLALLGVAAVAGAVLGVLRLQGRPLVQQMAGTLATALLLGGVDLLVGGILPVRLVLAAGTVVVAVVCKRQSQFRHHLPPPRSEVFLDTVRSALVILGAITLVLALLMGLTDSWDAV